MEKYDIFISYRREGGFETAKHLYDLLKRDGYTVSFDIDTLRNGDFDTSLLRRIDNCKDFILIVDRHAFDRTLDPSFNRNHDWMRIELAYALKHGKNVIPIFLSGVNGFPVNLPADIASVARKNGPSYNKEYFDEFYERLKKRFLLSRKFGYVSRIFSSVMSKTLSLFSKRESTEQKITEQELTDQELIEQAYSAYEAKDYDKAFELYLKAADQGNAKAQFWIGFFYNKGLGVEKSFSKALKWYKLAADQGNAIAQYNIGCLYVNGFGVEKNYSEAFKWYKLAADQDDTDAQNGIGYLYLNGFGVEEDDSEAMKWFKLAADQGNASAQYNLGYLYQHGLEVEKNYAEAMKWYKLATDQGNENAFQALNHLYLESE